MLACFNLYCRIPFGRLHKGNPQIVEAARDLHRTPSAVAMKLVNFASFDPAQLNRNVKGLVNVSRLDRAVWRECELDPNSIAARSEEAFDRLIGPGATEEEAPAPPQGPTEKLLERPMRLVQRFFRGQFWQAMATGAVSAGLTLRHSSMPAISFRGVSLLNSALTRETVCVFARSMIALFRGLVAVDTGNRVVISERLSRRAPVPLQRVAFFELEGG